MPVSATHNVAMPLEAPQAGEHTLLRLNKFQKDPVPAPAKKIDTNSQHKAKGSAQVSSSDAPTVAPPRAGAPISSLDPLEDIPAEQEDHREAEMVSRMSQYNDLSKGLLEKERRLGRLGVRSR